MGEKSLEAQIEELKKENAYFKTKGSIGLYYELNRVVNNTVAYSRKLSIDDLLSSETSGDKKFEKVQILLKNAKEHTEWMEENRTKIGITGDEDKDNKRSFVDTIAESRR